MHGELSLLGVAVELAREVLRLHETLPEHVVVIVGEHDGARVVGLRHECLPIEGCRAVGCIAIIDDAQMSRLRAYRCEGIVVARLLGDKGLLPTLQQYRLAGVGQVVDADGERAPTAQCLELYLPLYLHNSLFLCQRPVTNESK